MASTATNPQAGQAAASKPPQLPPNVTIFSPRAPSAADALLSGRIFTRLTTTAATTSAQLAAVLRKIQTPPGTAGESFCLAYNGGILIFDGGDAEPQEEEEEEEEKGEDEELLDAHHEHFRAVCLALKDEDVDLDVSGCVFDAKSVLQAGFQLDALSPETVLVIDLVDNDDDDDDAEDDDDEEVTEESLGALGMTS
ncbi:uncharacterized protein VDAG_05056 [Verticillium dahliae VdLs.17]|uniref:Uncharacterized protein n=1 Tax=Verticillium dahliae (strain VdLs.17 / ATCC MYA-4575 / FGSC 10137) TaxID=498257 RepID=G2X4H4_VERDV|nr:uncharacterized protein VDAG_05056 [Verticillium dahliae VdLs.17]EGY23618.1 hypothetical protein VDAG_05056 [Verticillium dahliae VdLs.17]